MLHPLSHAAPYKPCCTLIDEEIDEHSSTVVKIFEFYIAPVKVQFCILKSFMNFVLDVSKSKEFELLKNNYPFATYCF